MGVDRDYAEGRLNVCLGHKSALPEGEEEMDGIVHSDVLESVVFDGNISIDTSGRGFRVGEVKNSAPFV